MVDVKIAKVASWHVTVTSNAAARANVRLRSREWLTMPENLLRDRQDALRQRRSFSEFPDSIQFLHFLAQCGHLALLRKRRRNDESIHHQRHRYDQAESFDNVHEWSRPIRASDCPASHGNGSPPLASKSLTRDDGQLNTVISGGVFKPSPKTGTSKVRPAQQPRASAAHNPGS
jgi:hypothetical protein